MAVAAALFRTTSTGTAVAEENSDVVSHDFSLERGPVKFTDTTGQTYLFLRLRIDDRVVSYYKSSGSHTGFSGTWFPCYDVKDSGHILKGTPVDIPRLYADSQVMISESFLYRISSEIGLRGMAALNLMELDQYEAFRARLLQDTPKTGDLKDRVGDLMEQLEGEFLRNTDLKEEVRAATIAELPSVAALQAFIRGVSVGGGRGRRTRRRKIDRSGRQGMRRK